MAGKAKLYDMVMEALPNGWTVYTQKFLLTGDDKLDVINAIRILLKKVNKNDRKAILESCLTLNEVENETI